MKHIRFVATCCALVTVVTMGPAGNAAARGTPDPARGGRLPVDEIDYSGDFVVLRDETGTPLVEELKGTIHLPDGGGGPWPVIVFIHGRHATCRVADRVETIFASWPCPEARPVTSDVPSYRGYDYLAHNLASHGYVVASVSANAINSYDFPLSLQDSGMHWRAQLVAETLDALHRWNREPGPREVADRLVGKLDFDRIGLMGHSRGGEGVSRFVTLNQDRGAQREYEGLRAVFALAPTDFYEEKVPGVHFGTLLPLCDGDVYDLEGAWTFDNARFLQPANYARVQFAVNGTNHNFFNTVWTFDDGPYAGDDEGVNLACDPKARGNVRLTARRQRHVGLNLMSAFLRRYVGGEKQLDPWMTGEATLARDTCGRPCRKVVLTSYIGPKDSMKMLIEPDDMGGGYTERGDITTSTCRPRITGGEGCPSAPNRSIARQLAISWRGKAALRVPLEAATDVRRFRALTFRTAVNFTHSNNRPGREQSVQVALIDARGHVARLEAGRYSAALHPPAGITHQQIVLNGVRIPLRDFRGVDLGRIVRVELRFGRKTRKGSIQLAELAFQER